MDHDDNINTGPAFNEYTLTGEALQRLSILSQQRRPKLRRMYRSRHRANYSVSLPLSIPTYLDEESPSFFNNEETQSSPSSAAAAAAGEPFRSLNPEFEATARAIGRESYVRTFKHGELATNRPAPRWVPDAAAFPIFAALPPELRDEVWRCTLEPRVFGADFIHQDTLQEPLVREGDDDDDDPESAYGGGRHGLRRHYPQTVLLRYGRLRMRRIPIFWVCRESRRLAILLYGDPARGDALFNPDLDSVRLDASAPPNELSSLVRPFTVSTVIRTGDSLVRYSLHLEPVPLLPDSGGASSSSVTFFRTSYCPRDDPLHNHTWCQLRSRDPDTRYYYGYSPALLRRACHVEIYLPLFHVILAGDVAGLYPEDVKNRTTTITTPPTAMANPAGTTMWDIAERRLGNPDASPFSSGLLNRLRHRTGPMPNLSRVSLMFYADANEVSYVRVDSMRHVDLLPLCGPRAPPVADVRPDDDGGSGGFVHAPQTTLSEKRTLIQQRGAARETSSQPAQIWLSFVAALIGDDRPFWPRLKMLNFVMENLDFSTKLPVPRVPNVRR